MQLDLFRQKGGMGLSEREAVEVSRLRWHAFRRAFVGPPCPEFIRCARPACRVISAAPPVIFTPEIEPELETLPEPSLEPEGEECDDFDMLDATPLDTSQILASARYQMEAERLQRLGCYRRACTRYRKALMLSLPGKRADRLRVMVNRCARMAGKRVRG